MDTARLTLSQLAAAGIREAEVCAQKLGLTLAMENYDVSREKIAPFWGYTSAAIYSEALSSQDCFSQAYLDGSADLADRVGQVIKGWNADILEGYWDSVSRIENDLREANDKLGEAQAEINKNMKPGRSHAQWLHLRDNGEPSSLQSNGIGVVALGMFSFVPIFP